MWRCRRLAVWGAGHLVAVQAAWSERRTEGRWRLRISKYLDKNEEEKASNEFCHRYGLRSTSRRAHTCAFRQFFNAA